MPHKRSEKDQLQRKHSALEYRRSAIVYKILAHHFTKAGDLERLTYEHVEDALTELTRVAKLAAPEAAVDSAVTRRPAHTRQPKHSLGSTP